MKFIFIIFFYYYYFYCVILVFQTLQNTLNVRKAILFEREEIVLLVANFSASESKTLRLFMI